MRCVDAEKSSAKFDACARLAAAHAGDGRRSCPTDARLAAPFVRLHASERARKNKIFPNTVLKLSLCMVLLQDAYCRQFRRNAANNGL